jgi:hypothetical protein
MYSLLQESVTRQWNWRVHAVCSSFSYKHIWITVKSKFKMYFNKSGLTLMNSTLHIMRPSFHILFHIWPSLSISTRINTMSISCIPSLVERSKIIHPREGPLKASKNLTFLLHPNYVTKNFPSIIIICGDHIPFIILLLILNIIKKFHKIPTQRYNSMRKIHNFLKGTH